MCAVVLQPIFSAVKFVQRCSRRQCSLGLLRLQRQRVLLSILSMCLLIGLISNVNPFSRKEPPCEKRLATVMIVGFGKCGTYALSKFMEQHPTIGLVQGEPKYFDHDRRYKRGIEWYRTKMPCTFPGQITLERATGYSFRSKAPERIKMYQSEINDTLKIIFIVRNPVSRVISHYSMVYNETERVRQSFESTILTKNGSVNPFHLWVRISQYAVYIKNWLQLFPREQIHVVDGDSFAKHPVNELRKIERFLNISSFVRDDHFVFNEKKDFYCYKNFAGGYENIECLGDKKGIKHIQVNRSTLEKLYKFYERDNEDFYKLVGKRFNWTIEGHI